MQSDEENRNQPGVRLKWQNRGFGAIFFLFRTLAPINKLHNTFSAAKFQEWHYTLSTQIRIPVTARHDEHCIALMVTSAVFDWY
jgi:hypothetical protein